MHNYLFKHHTKYNELRMVFFMNGKIIDVNGVETIVSLDDTTMLSIPTHTLSSGMVIGDSIKLDINNIPNSLNNGHNAPLCQKLMDFF